MGRRIQRKLRRLCPECEESCLEVIAYDNVRNGIVYNKTRIECSFCGYKEEGKTYRLNKRKPDFWE